FLAPYRQAQHDLGPAFDALSQLVAADPVQTRRLADLRRMADQWDATARPLIVSGAGDVHLARELHIDGKRQMDMMRDSLAELLAAEIDRRDQRSAAAARAATVGIPIGLLLTLGIVALLAIVTRRNLRALAQHYGQAIADMQAQADARLHLESQ